MPAVNNSTELRNAIQSVTVVDPVITLNGSTTDQYSVLTLAQRSSFVPGASGFNGYTIEGTSSTLANSAKLVNTRIYQQNVDSAFAPGVVRNLTLNYTLGGAADNGALLSVTSTAARSITLNNVQITGAHNGWNGNGNLYMSLRSFNAAAPLNTSLTLTGVTVNLTGQGNAFNGSTGGSAFLHSWNNSGAVTISGSTFDEAGYASSFNFLTSSTTAAGNISLTNNTFRRTTNATVRPQGNRLGSVVANLTGNTFQDGSYLDLYGDVGAVTLNSNTFTMIAGGYGIRVNDPVTGTPTLTGANVFTGPGLPLKYVNAAANTSYTLTGGTITVNGSAFTNLIAGGQGADTISGTANANYINGDDGADNISGLAGNDSLLGGAGNDTILGGDNNDTIEGGAGADSLNGGNGIDTLSYANSSAAVSVNLLTNTASGGDAAGDSISLFENLIGSANADTLTGNNAANIITGEAGADTILGGSGSDTLDGGLGDDIIFGGIGADRLTGGLGADRFAWNTSDGSDTITDFSTAQGDQMALSDIFNNTAPGNTLAAADYATAATFATVSNADDNKVIEVTTSQTSAQISGNISGLTNAYILVFNSTVGNAQLIFDANWANATGRTVAANLTSINNLALTNAFTNTNFYAF